MRILCAWLVVLSLGTACYAQRGGRGGGGFGGGVSRGGFSRGGGFAGGGGHWSRGGGFGHFGGFGGARFGTPSFRGFAGSRYGGWGYAPSYWGGFRSYSYSFYDPYLYSGYPYDFYYGGGHGYVSYAPVYRTVRRVRTVYRPAVPVRAPLARPIANGWANDGRWHKFDEPAGAYRQGMP